MKKTYTNVIAGILLIFCAGSALASPSTCPENALSGSGEWSTVGFPGGDYIAAAYIPSEDKAYCFYGTQDNFENGFLMSNFKVKGVSGSDWQKEKGKRANGQYYICVNSLNSCQFKGN